MSSNLSQKLRYSFIYQIINILDHKSYIGQTINSNIEKYIFDHFKAKDPNKVLHRAIRKHGKENFTYKILWKGFATRDHLNNLEIFFIAYYNTNIRQNGYGYNMILGGGNSWNKTHNKNSWNHINKIGINKVSSQKGQNNPCSKTNMSKEKRLLKAKKSAETKKKKQ